MKDKIPRYQDTKPSEFRTPTAEERLREMYHASKCGVKRVEHIPSDPLSPEILIEEGVLTMVGATSRDIEEPTEPDMFEVIPEAGVTFTPKMQEWISIAAETRVPKKRTKKGPGRHKEI